MRRGAVRPYSVPRRIQRRGRDLFRRGAGAAGAVRPGVDLLGAYAQQQDELHARGRFEKDPQYILGTSCGAWWHGTVCTDGAPNGYGVFEYDGTSLTNMIYKPTRYDRDLPDPSLQRRRRLYGRYGQVVEVRSATAEEPADGQRLERRRYVDDRGLRERREDGRHGEEIDDRSVVVGLFLRLLRFEGELRQQERPYLFIIRSRAPVPRCASWRATVTATSSSRPRSRRRSKRTIPTPIDRSLRSVVFSSSEGRRPGDPPGLWRKWADAALLLFPRWMRHYCSNATTFARIAVRVIPPASAVMRRAGAASWSSTWCVTVRLSGTSSVKVWPPSSMQALPSASTSR